jgi:dolichol-phosphate mannosyltransferase
VITVVLPAYNEEQAIVPLLDALRHTLQDQARVVVVDDGSTDRTAERVRAYPWSGVELVSHERNMGLSQAIRTGLTHALQMANGGEVIVTMDTDNTHPPALIPRMAALISKGYDMVIASRYAPGGRSVGLAPTRRAFSYGASLIFRLFFPTPEVRDYTCGYRAYRKSVLRQGFDRWGDDFIAETGFTCTVEILLNLREMGVRMTEVPLVLRYDRKRGDSKMKVWRTIRQTLFLIFRRWRKRL